MNTAARMSGKKVTVLLYGGVLVTIAAVVGVAYSLGRPGDKPLPVDVQLDKRAVPVPDGSGAQMTDVVVVTNRSDAEIPKLDISINGQYFLYRDTPLTAREELVVPVSIFSTKSNQRYDPTKYPALSIVVTGQLPSGARGVREVEFQE